MGRRPRIHYPGAVYHVMARGVDGRDVFIDDVDRAFFLKCLDQVKAETGTTILAYCLMGNHFHLAVKVSSVPLGAVIQRILTSYAITFNLRHGRTGHLFQARYKAILCLDDRYLLGLIRYIQMNPVRAGFVSAAEDWRWSSRSPNALPNLDEDEFDPWPKGAAIPTLVRPGVEKTMAIGAIGENISAASGVSLVELKSGSKRRTIVAAKIRMAKECVRAGYRLSEIADWLNLPVRSISYYLKTN